MALQSGTILGITLVSGNPSGLSDATPSQRFDFLVTANFPAFTSGTDTAALPLIGAAIAAETRSGKSVTLRDGLCAGPGQDANGVEVYTNPPTVSGDGLTFNLTNAAGTAQTSVATNIPVSFIVAVDFVG